MSDETKETQAANEPKPTGPPKSVYREYFESFVVTLVMAIFGMTFILQAVTVPTGSMQNTILVGDYLLVNKFIFTPGGSSSLPFLPQREIERGDIIVFKYPGNKGCPKNDSDRGIIPYQINYVKRVIGLPGETVEFRDNQVFINGKLLPEHRMLGNAKDSQSALNVSEFEQRGEGENYNVYYDKEIMDAVRNGQQVMRGNGKDPCRGYQFGVADKPMTVPENSFFVMGDSRDNSEDSRFWGFVPRDLIVGRAMFVYWSCDRGATDKWYGCLTHPRLSRIGHFVK